MTEPSGELTRASLSRAPLSRDAVRRAWAARGFGCDLWVDPPGAVWEDFVHDTDELVLLLGGALVLELEGRVLSLQPGDEVLVPAGTRHSVRNLGDTTARWLYGYRRAR